MNTGSSEGLGYYRTITVVPLLLSPVGNYLAMAYTRKIGQQPDNFLSELYQHNQGW